MHHPYVGDVAVGKNHEIGFFTPNQRFQLFLRVNGNAFRIERSGKSRGINAVRLQRYLGGGEGHHAVIGIILEQEVEIVKIPARRAHDDDFFSHRTSYANLNKSLAKVQRHKGAKI